MFTRAAYARAGLSNRFCPSVNRLLDLANKSASVKNCGYIVR